MKMFKQRLITALALIFIVLGLIYYANSWVLSVAILVLYLALGWEWLALVPIVNLTHKILAMLALLLAFLLSVQYWDLCLLINFPIWGLIIGAIVTYPRTKFLWDKNFIVAF